MDRKWVPEGGEKPLEVHPRHLKMQSAQAIRSVQDALVELITNSDDAYRNSHDKEGKILVEVTRRRGDTSGEVVVKDRAGGMTLEEMKEKILKYGRFVAEDRSRGFMGRGAKDIAALGDAAFESIKDGKIHRVDISSEFRGNPMKSMSATEQDYDEFGLKPGKGGMRVTLRVSKDHKVPQHETMCRDLQRHYALRDIIQRREIRVKDLNSGQEGPLHYAPPGGELVLDETLKFSPPYEGATARLRISKAPSELPTDLQEGIIVCDEHAVHQSTRFSPELEQDSTARRFFGRLQCDHIRRLQLDFEWFRENKRKLPDHNPVDIVDPNRRRGLDREGHPFVTKLFDWAERLLREQVERVKKEEGSYAGRVANEDTEKRLKELSKAVARHLEDRIEEEVLTPRTPEEEAELNKEGVLLNPQFKRIAVGEKRRMGYTALSFGEDTDPPHVRVELDGEGLKVVPERPLLRPQKRNPDRLTAYFEVEGVKPTKKVTLTVRHKHDEVIAPVFRELEVVEPQDPYARLPYGVFFENQNYTVHDNGTRTLIFHAKGRRFRSVDWGSPRLIRTTNPESVAILRGSAINVHVVANDVWKGEIQVRGQGIGKRSVVSLNIQSKTGDETTNAVVEVVGEKEPPKVSIRIDLVPDSAGQWRAEWDRSDPNRLKVYAKHPTLGRYLGREQDGYPGQQQLHFRILLAEIVADKVVQRILEDKAKFDKDLFANANAFFFKYSEEMTSFLPITHKIMLPDTEANRAPLGK